MKNQSVKKLLFIVLSILCLSPWVSSATALFAGIIFSLFIGNPFQEWTTKAVKKLLALAVIGLGAGMDLNVVTKVGLQSVGFTALSILAVFVVGTLLGKLFKTPLNTTLLINSGTAICGGSAIAAVAPVIKAKNHEVTVSLAVVFTLNAVALFVFPWVGHLLKIDQTSFGLWSALAIHDTSSVVGASLSYGPQALEVGTIVKLVRALWIIPLALIFSVTTAMQLKKQGASVQTKTKKPWFILGFITAAALVTFIPELKSPGLMIYAGAKKLMVLTLFYIGSSITLDHIKEAGVKPMLQGVILWCFTAISTLTLIMTNIINFK
ncbi:putative sulfate exporter family transporter [Halobacteriovorax sp. XZX-3]|uniref:YeiH family protein n=1 Tax=unclassified Halobacteriovorax TaxID=2639665 RepID=UPI00371DA7F4